MNKRFLFFIALFAFTRLLAQTNGPVRLALISENDPAATAADVLTAQFSGNQKIQLLERNQIARVYREQGLSAANTDYLKLGQILGADGLLLLQTATEGTNQFLNVRLMAVKPGVVLLAERYPWPVTDLTEWSPAFAKHLDLFLPKLTVLVKDAIPISVVNLRSSIQSADSVESEQQLKLLTIQRLSREPQLFVLERQKMQLLGEEKDLNLDDSAFWNGSYLLEGVVDQNGYSKETITINARLTPPKGGAALQFEADGSRTNLAEVINQLAVKVNEVLKVNSTVKEWNAADEAAQYFDEAKWAMRWGLFHEAQEASESAWALGQRTTAVMSLRLQSYLDEAPSFTRSGTTRYFVLLPTPDPANLELAIHVVELYNRDIPLVMAQGGSSVANNPSSAPNLAATAKGVLKVNGRIQAGGTIAFSNNVEWFDIGIAALEMSSAVLQNFNQAAEARSEHELQLSELRGATRQLVTALETNVPPDTLSTLKWEDGGRWFDKPETALPMYEKMLKSGYRPSTHDIGDDRENRNFPQIVGWSWEDRKRIPDLLRQFAAKLAVSTNQDLQLEGLLYKLMLTPYDSSGRLDAIQNELYGQIWEQRQSLFAGRIEASVIGRIEESLCYKHGMSFGNLRWQPFLGFKQHLRKDYLAHIDRFDDRGFEALFFPVDITGNLSMSAFSKSEIAEILPMLVDFKRRLNLSRTEGFRVDQVPGILAEIDSSKAKAKLNLNSGETSARSAVSKPNAIKTVVEFTSWKLDLPPMDPDLRPVVRTSIYRHGKLWVQILCCKSGVSRDNFRTVFASVDPQTGLCEVIPFPSELGSPDRFFEITADSLYAIQGNRLEQYPFQTKRWETVNIPMQGDVQILELKDRLYLATSDAILELAPDTQTIQILASLRRRPAINRMDELDGFGRIFAGNDGKLVVSAQQSFFTYLPDSHKWKEVPGAMEDAVTWYTTIPTRYEKDGRPIDPFDRSVAPTPNPVRLWEWSAAPPVKLDMPLGRFVISPSLMGHWLIPKTVLVSSLEELRHFVLTNTPAFQKP